MSAWHALRLSLDQVQYTSVDAYLAFHLGVVVLCPMPAQKSAPVAVCLAPPAVPLRLRNVPQGFSWVPVPIPADAIAVRHVRAFASDSSKYTSDSSSG